MSSFFSYEIPHLFYLLCPTTMWIGMYTLVSSHIPISCRSWYKTGTKLSLLRSCHFCCTFLNFDLLISDREVGAEVTVNAKQTTRWWLFYIENIRKIERIRSVILLIHLNGRIYWWGGVANFYDDFSLRLMNRSDRNTKRWNSDTATQGRRSSYFKG